MKFVQTDLSKKTRKILLTINNPTKPETTPKGCLIPEDIMQDCLNGDEKAKECIINIVKQYIDSSTIVNGKTGVYYCFTIEIGKEGTLHIHIFFQFENPRLGNSIKKVFPTSHIDYCNGSNNSAREYVFKIGKWEGDPKADTRIDGVQYENGTLPEEKGQGERTDLEMIRDLIDSGLHPQQILDSDPNNYRLEGYIRKMYFDKRKKETPIKRSVEVVIHTGVAGSGKSNVMTLIDENTIFIATDYSAALFDNFCGEEVLFLDEFRGQIPYNQLLIMLDGYKVPIHARYANVLSVWNTVHITSVIPVEEWYNLENIRDTFEQLKRRIAYITYHYMTCNNVFIPDKMAFLKDHDKSEIEYREYTIKAEQYTSYEELEKEALEAAGIEMKYNSELDETVFNDSTIDDEYKNWLQSKGWEENSMNFAIFWEQKAEQIKAEKRIA